MTVAEAFELAAQLCDTRAADHQRTKEHHAREGNMHQEIYEGAQATEASKCAFKIRELVGAFK